MAVAVDISALANLIDKAALSHECSVDAFTGSANTSVPIPLAPGRSQFQPNLALGYSSGSRNSVFGFGWSLSGASAVRLSTRDGLPDYGGEEHYEFDGQELVPWLDQTGRHRSPTNTPDGFRVLYYREQSEINYRRFEKWISEETRRVHWRVRDGTGGISIFGLADDNTSRIIDPADDRRVFAWLIEMQFDGKGNAIYYEYLAENALRVDRRQIFESRRRPEFFPTAQRYLKAVYYGNRRPLDPTQSMPDPSGWRYMVVFDYGDHGIIKDNDTADIPRAEPTFEWSARADPYSTYNLGFELRTYRLCQRVLLFHQFDELGPGPTLVGQLRLNHTISDTASTLAEIIYTGFRRRNQTEAYDRKSLPSLRLQYTDRSIDRQFRHLEERSVQNAPQGINATDYQWIDILGEGIPGILYRSGMAWLHKPNLGGGKLGPLQSIGHRPSAASVASISDFDGDGNPNLVVLGGQQAGYFEYDPHTSSWAGFRTFETAPQTGGNTQVLDFDADGRGDIVTSETDRVTWYSSQGKRGFDPPKNVAVGSASRTGGNAAVGENRSLDRFYADMTGDGLPDQVFITSGCVEYWPNLGNGHFGAGIVMEIPTDFISDPTYNASRVRLHDLDGSGTSDIIYLGRGEIRIWYNDNGNRLVDGGRINDLPYIDDLASVQMLDLLGDGTACLVWSSGLPGRDRSPISYLRLGSSNPARLLEALENGFGKRTSFTYSNSAMHYLRDKNLGRGWYSLLPQHRTVVDSLEVFDEVGGARAITRYVYHDGIFDSVERSFRGFALVEQYDTEYYKNSSEFNESEFQTPVCTRTWFYDGRPDWRTRHGGDFYRGDPEAENLKNVTLAGGDDLLPEDQNRGLKAATGNIARTEVFGVDANGIRLAHPFEVSEFAYLIRARPPSDNGLKPAFSVQLVESLRRIYEQKAADPRTEHEVVLDVDDYGSAKRSVSIAYPRRASAPERRVEQVQPIATCTDLDILNLDNDNQYELGIPLGTRTFELKHVLTDEGSIAARAQLIDDVAAAIETHIQFGEHFVGTEPRARLENWSRQYYWNSDGSAPLPYGQISQPALPHHEGTAVLPSDPATEFFGDGLDSDQLLGRSGHIERNGYWWRPSPQTDFYDAEAFYLPADTMNADGGRTVLEYDPHWMAVIAMIDPVGNLQRNQIDYHLMTPWQVTDANGNIEETSFDPLGLPVAVSNYGTAQTPVGAQARHGYGTLAERRPTPPPTREAILDRPEAFVQESSAFIFFDFFNWDRARAPNAAIILNRQDLVHDSGSSRSGMDAAIGIAVGYVDGFGRILQSKERSEAGPAIHRDDRGILNLGADGQPILEPAQTRWRASGHIVFNNKQLPIKQFEPFFSTTHAFEEDAELESLGHATLFQYDAVGRQTRVLFPNGTVAKQDYEPWLTRSYDANDAIDEAVGYRAIRQAMNAQAPERLALSQAERHVNTPTISHLDPTGRAVAIVENGKDGEVRATESELDAAGQPILVRDARGLVAMRYRRDMAGRIIHEQNMDAGAHTTVHNAMDQPILTWDSKGTEVETEYDLAGRPTIIRTNSNGRTWVSDRFVYGDEPTVPDGAARNARGRLLRHFDAASIAEIKNYDIDGRPLESHRQIARDVDNEIDWVDINRVDLEETKYVSRGRYDGLGRLIEHQPPDGSTRRYQYHPGGLAGITFTSADGALSDHAVLKDATFTAFGERATEHLGNDVLVSYEYDPMTRRLARLRSQRIGAGQGTATARRGRIFQDLKYTYDPAGNVVQIADRVQAAARHPISGLGSDVSGSRTFEHDPYYQLVRATGRVHRALVAGAHDPRLGGLKSTRTISLNDGGQIGNYTRTYSYDPAGNMKRMKHTGGTNAPEGWRTDFWRSATSNRSLPQVDHNGVAITDPEGRFDAAGNCRQLAHVAGLEWNARNQLKHVTIVDRSASGRPDDEEIYLYGGDGQRVRKIHRSLMETGEIRTEEKLYLDGCEIRHVRVGDRTVLERVSSYIEEGSRRFAIIHDMRKDTRRSASNRAGETRIHYQLTDRLGSTTLELAPNGDVISYEESFPFGGTAFLAGRDGPTGRDVSLREYRFMGKERDDATGFYYFGFRYYAPWLARWLSPDPIGTADGLNLYQFVQNNPVTLVDEDGLQTSDPTARFHELLRRGDLEPEGPPIQASQETFSQGFRGFEVIFDDTDELGSVSVTRRDVSFQVLKDVTTGEIESVVENPSIETELGRGRVRIVLNSEGGSHSFIEFDSEAHEESLGAGLTAPDSLSRASSNADRNQPSLDELIGPTSDEDFRDLISDLAFEATISGILDTGELVPFNANDLEPFDRFSYDFGVHDRNRLIADQLAQQDNGFEAPGWLKAAGIVALGALMIAGGIALAGVTGGASAFAAVEATMMIAGGVSLVSVGTPVAVASATGAMDETETDRAVEGLQRVAGLTSPVVLSTTTTGLLAEGLGAPEGSAEFGEAFGNAIDLGRALHSLGRTALESRGFDSYSELFQSRRNPQSTIRRRELVEGLQQGRAQSGSRIRFTNREVRALLRRTPSRRAVLKLLEDENIHIAADSAEGLPFLAIYDPATKTLRLAVRNFESAQQVADTILHEAFHVRFGLEFELFARDIASEASQLEEVLAELAQITESRAWLEATRGEKTALVQETIDWVLRKYDDLTDIPAHTNVTNVDSSGRLRAGQLSALQQVVGAFYPQLIAYWDQIIVGVLRR